MTGLLLDHDEAVGAYLFASHEQSPMKFDRAIGLISKEGKLAGAVLFHNWNGANVEISYYGANTMTPGVVRFLSRFVIAVFDPSRLSATVSKRNRSFIRSMQRLGFRMEGAQRCYYGKQDCIRNTGVKLVMFRSRLDELAGYAQQKVS